MASIEQRGETSFRLTVETGYLPDGTRDRERKTVKVNKALLRSPRKLQEFLNMELAKFQLEVEGGITAPEEMNFSQFCSEWKDKFVSKLEFKTQENYILHLDSRILPHFGKKRISAIKTMHLIDFLHNLKSLKNPEKPAGDATHAYVYRVLNSIFTKAIEWKVITSNPIDGVPKPKEPDTISELNVYSEEELQTLFAALKTKETWFQLLITLAITTGMRRGELLGLEWKHIDIERKIIRVRQSIPAFSNGMPIIKSPKTKGSVRNVAISDIVIAQLNEYKKEWDRNKEEYADVWKCEFGEFLFCNRFGMPYYPKTLTEKWRDFNKEIPNLKFIRFHDFRHTSASILISEGAHPKAISNRLGHSKIGTTMDVYGHIIESVDHKTASLFDGVLRKKDGD
ncbi:integrase [Paenibacillus dendritiformis C454]|uniref:Integrase n=1 Tax=Paenibacillus dendritiformis C454 TaxID=1131935 RepID=H3SBE4_9BACL|nr:tyrosine-type recombinase/integrase [Paenibacillus dendritiformis]EHQ63627.1 integrase [Paenibacillus dendritiformis C454]